MAVGMKMERDILTSSVTLRKVILSQPMGEERLRRINALIEQYKSEKQDLTVKLHKAGPQLVAQGIVAGGQAVFNREVELINFMYRYIYAGKRLRSEMSAKLSSADTKRMGLLCSLEELLLILAEIVETEGSVEPVALSSPVAVPPRGKKVPTGQLNFEAANQETAELLKNMRDQLQGVYQIAQQLGSKSSIEQPSPSTAEPLPPDWRKVINREIGLLNRELKEKKESILKLQETLAREQTRCRSFQTEAVKYRNSSFEMKRLLVDLKEILSRADHQESAAEPLRLVESMIQLVLESPHPSYEPPMERDKEALGLLPKRSPAYNNSWINPQQLFLSVYLGTDESPGLEKPEQEEVAHGIKMIATKPRTHFLKTQKVPRSKEKGFLRSGAKKSLTKSGRFEIIWKHIPDLDTLAIYSVRRLDEKSVG